MKLTQKIMRQFHIAILESTLMTQKIIISLVMNLINPHPVVKCRPGIFFIILFSIQSYTFGYETPVIWQKKSQFTHYLLVKNQIPKKEIMYM